MASTPGINQSRAAFIKAATWHGSLDEADAILAGHPELARLDIHIASILGDHDTVREFLAQNKDHATATSEPYGANPLTHLCLSKYLRFEKKPSEDFIRAASLLLDTGADPNGGFWTDEKFPEYETPLYGAAGVAHHTGLTQLLLERGADPNDEEAVYHSPETYDNDAMKRLVETGRLTTDNLSIMLMRKHDWHDEEGVAYLLARGADPNIVRSKGWSPLHHALARCNGLAIITRLMDYKGDPMLVSEGLTATARAAREGRGDVLRLFQQRGYPIDLPGVDKLIAAAAMEYAAGAAAVEDSAGAAAIAAAGPTLRTELMALKDTLLARFVLSNNLGGIKIFFQLGMDVNTPYIKGDGYWCIPPGSLPIHIAAWLLHPEMVELLLDNGAIVDQPDANGETPLMLAVRACLESYWKRRCPPRLLVMLLEAGASPHRVPFPTGNSEIDAVITKYRK
ncbi:MAG TPA: ankyrin repeat domain-containing protein [Puia sp.]|jgi:ankyrin repeat protein